MSSSTQPVRLQQARSEANVALAQLLSVLDQMDEPDRTCAVYDVLQDVQEWLGLLECEA